MIQFNRGQPSSIIISHKQDTSDMFKLYNENKYAKQNFAFLSY